MSTQAHYNIGELARLAGVSIRTLRHYDDIGLLTPSSRADNSYRVYTEADCQRLFDILFYRALGFALSEITQLLQLSVTDRCAKLLQQRGQLDIHLERLQRMRAHLNQLITDQEHQAMNTSQFAAFANFDPDQYEEEVQQRWGDTDAYKESARRTKRYTPEDWQRYRQEAEILNQAMAALMDRGIKAQSLEALEVVEKMRLLIDTWFYPCPRGMHTNLGEMYVQDERYAAYFEKVRPGMAKFVRDAIMANR
ncbi:MAG: MerR family transcriptional regulator [Pseudomonadota bacterium]